MLSQFKLQFTDPELFFIVKIYKDILVDTQTCSYDFELLFNDKILEPMKEADILPYTTLSDVVFSVIDKAEAYIDAIQELSQDDKTICFRLNTICEKSSLPAKFSIK